MKRVIVIGCPGSGKTTFAEKLRDRSGLPLFYLDAIWHKPDRTHISREEFDACLGEILAKDAWIIDGHYSRTLERRLAACDTVVLFDLPVEECLAGAVARIGQRRPDMPWVDTALDPTLKKDIEELREKQLPVIYALIERYQAGRNIHVCKSRAQAEGLLRGIEEIREQKIGTECAYEQ